MYFFLLFIGVLIDKIGWMVMIIVLGIIFFLVGLVVVMVLSDLMVFLVVVLLLFGLGWNLGLISGIV